MTATGALVGTAIGSQLGQIYLKEALAFTSGGFLYFAVNGLLSELKEVDDLLQLFFCFCSMSVGLYMMYVFALFEWKFTSLIFVKILLEDDFIVKIK